MKKTICIYHKGCADGFGAAWAVWKALGDADVEYFGGIYGDPPPDVTGRNVIMVDFSYKRDVLETIIASAERVCILDHHKTAEEDLAGLDGIRPGVEVLFDQSKSGAVIAWEWFHPHSRVPLLLCYVQDRDLWRFHLECTREIMAAVYSYPFTFEDWETLAPRCDDGDLMLRLIEEGAAINRQHEKNVKSLVGSTRRAMIIGGYNVPVANVPYMMASDAGTALCNIAWEPPKVYDEGNALETPYPPAFSATYYDTPEGRVFSLRSRGEFDVSAIAKRYGGGGHKNAAGFRMPLGWEGEVIEYEKDKECQGNCGACECGPRSETEAEESLRP